MLVLSRAASTSSKTKNGAGRKLEENYNQVTVFYLFYKRLGEKDEQYSE